MDINKKLEAMENEITNLKSMIIKISQSPKQRKIVELKGLLKGFKIDDEDIAEAKATLFKTGG